MHPVSAQSLLLSSSWSRLEKDALLINSVKLTLKCFEAAAVQTSGLVNIVYFSNGEWSTRLWTQLMQLHKKPEKKIQDFNTIWTCDLAIPVQCSNQLSYEATDVGSWSIMCLVRASHWYHKVTGSNPVEVLYFFFRLLKQLHKSRSQLRGSFFIWFHFCRSYMIYFIYIYHIVYFCQMFLECKHLFIDIKPMVITEATVPGAQLLGRDSKRYPCTWQHTFMYKLCLMLTENWIGLKIE